MHHQPAQHVLSCHIHALNADSNQCRDVQLVHETTLLVVIRSQTSVCWSPALVCPSLTATKRPDGHPFYAQTQCVKCYYNLFSHFSQDWQSNCEKVESAVLTIGRLERGERVESHTRLHFLTHVLSVKSALKQHLYLSPLYPLRLRTGLDSEDEQVHEGGLATMSTPFFSLVLLVHLFWDTLQNMRKVLSLKSIPKHLLSWSSRGGLCASKRYFCWPEEPLLTSSFHRDVLVMKPSYLVAFWTWRSHRHKHDARLNSHQSRITWTTAEVGDKEE